MQEYDQQVAGLFDMRPARDPVDEHGGAGRLVALLEELVVDLVGHFEILVLVEEDVAHDDVPEVEPGLLERRLDVLHRLPDLLVERRGMSCRREAGRPCPRRRAYRPPGCRD